MSDSSNVRSHKTFPFKYYSVRNVSCPEDTENNRKVYFGHAPISSLLDLSTDANVRGYLLEAEGKQRRRPTQVHKAIQDTLENTQHNFSILNSGIVIVARDCEIDEKDKFLKLTRPSIINGAQTQGVISDLFKKNILKIDGTPIHVKFEIIVTDDEELIAEISIARNFQNDVMSISIAGRLKILDELEKSFQAKLPETKLQKSETQLSDDYIKTERLLQVIAALIPEELWLKSGDFNKVYTYSRKAACLKEFQELFEMAHIMSDPQHPLRLANDSKFGKHVQLYEFYLDIAAQAWELYEHWKRHQGFYGTRLRAIERDDNGQIKEVPDGIVFPILASLSVFAKKTRTGWKIQPPSAFNDKELIEAAATAYQEMADSNPNVMGKTKACYSSLSQITSIFKRLMN